MTEADWLNSTDPLAMLTFLRDSGRLSERETRLFACAAVRRVWHLLIDERSKRAVEVAEQYADGLVGGQEREAAAQNAEDAYNATARGAGHRYYLAAVAAHSVITDDPDDELYRGWYDSGTAAEDPPAAFRTQAGLLRDIFINPFRPSPPIPSGVLLWNRGTVRWLAEQAYQERSLPEGTLDSQRLGVLADAMEEAGCTDQDILWHLRQQAAVHVRGCWVIDLLLTKE